MFSNYLHILIIATTYIRKDVENVTHNYSLRLQWNTEILEQVHSGLVIKTLKQAFQARFISMLSDFMHIADIWLEKDNSSYNQLLKYW